MSQRIAFFDFDGTITTKDTMLEVIKFQKGTLAFYLGFLLLSPVLVAYKLKLFPNWKAKQMVLRYFFGGTDEEEFQKKCDEFALNVIPALVRPKALATIVHLKENNVRIVMVTASAANWVKGWCEKMKIEYLATCLEVVNGKITGNIDGKNCYGPEKVARIKNTVNLNDFDEVLAFGDSAGDREMFQLSTHQFYKPFGASWEIPQMLSANK